MHYKLKFFSFILILVSFLASCRSPAEPTDVARVVSATPAVNPTGILPTIRPTAEPPTARPTQTATIAPTATPRQTFTPIPTSTASPTLPPIVTATATDVPTASPTAAPTIWVTPPLPALPAQLPPPSGNISNTVRVPILMYHYVSTPPQDADNYRINLSVPPDRFRQQMAYLAENGYTVIDLYDVIEAIVNETELPPKPVVLTFDDGYVDNYFFAYPIMEEFGFEGTFFIVTEFVDFGYEAYMSWPMIEEMAADGHRMESHTKSHPDLSQLRRNDLVWQILGSQETLAAHIGYKPQFLSYPGGRYNEETIAMAEELSIWAAVTTQGGMWRGYLDRYEWPRTRVSFNTTLADLEKALTPRGTPTPRPTP